MHGLRGNMVLKKVTGLLSRRPGSSDDTPTYGQDSPEGNAARGVRLFCESGGPNNATEEIQYLPEIVTAAESSPAAAEACAYQIRKFLSKDNYSKPHVQYNAVMLIRILADNPGPTFTRNMDGKFTSTVKDLLRNGRDPSVQQILRETLFSLERDKAYDTNLNPLFNMWRKEYVNGVGANVGPRALNAPPWDPSQAQNQQAFGGGQHRSHRSRGLPPPVELAARIEEARTSAKLLLQLIQSTTPDELPQNDLVKEFGERCQQAQRSIQGYINSVTEDSTQADDDTMLTLIETNEQLSLALTKHQRAYLTARRTHSSNSVPQNGAAAAAAAPPSQSERNSPAAAEAGYAPPPGLPPRLQASLARREGSGGDDNDPFSDSHAHPHPLEPANYGNSASNEHLVLGRTSGDQNRGSPTSYHPGYQSTPSYLARQDSADANRTMHGGAAAETTFSPVDERSGGGTHSNEAPDVSPVEERRVVYRY